MLINLRNALMAGKRLPYDTEVEYLESTGTQYINLGFSLTPSSDLYATVMLRTTVSNGAIFGQSYRVYWGANYPAYAIANSSAGKIFFAYGPTNNLYTSDIGVGTLTDISYVGTTYTINGTTTTIPRVSSWSAIQGNAHVFCRGYADGTISPISKARVYSIKIVDNGATTHHYIPVRKGTVGYLYDRVSGKLFGNAGTGDFVLGPDVVPVEWLKSDGTPYIDTGVVVQSSDVIKFRSKSSAGGSAQIDAIRSSVGAWNASPNYYLMTKISGASAFQVWAYATYKDIIMGYSGGDKYIGKVNSWEINLAEGFAKIETYDNTYRTSISPGGPSPDQPTLKLMPPNASRAISVYDFSITRNGAKVLNFAPVRVGSGSTWEGAMMDTLTRRIYRNAGTGAFSYGNDLKYPIPAS